MHLITRRSLLRSPLLGLTGASLLQRRADAAVQKMKITRIRMYESPDAINRPIVNQSHHIVTIETDAGITGIGEGGTPDLMRQLAQQLIGQDPLRIDQLWQLMYRGYFYPAGREKLHALGALDLALWDIKGKALDVPVWQLLGGQARDYVECYSTGFPRAQDGTTRSTARACVQAGFRAFRTGVADAGQTNGQPNPFNAKHMVHKTHEQCKEIREGVGSDGDWAIDYHTRLDFPDAVRLSTLLEPLEPYFVEDLVRSENPGVYKQLRPLVKVPIAVGEQFGDRWDINELVENRLIDYSRITIPNAGGLTEFWKHAVVCETHYVGLIPHFTGPLSEAACVHCCTVFPGPALMEMTGAGPRAIPYLPQSFDFKEGKLWPNQRPGLGVTLDASKMKLFFESTQHAQKITLFKRPDGSITNW